MEEIIMKIKLTSVFVDDQDKALKLYTEVLGFQKKGHAGREIQMVNSCLARRA